MTAKGILFVSHEGSRTGAPMELLHFLRWYKVNGRRPFSILAGTHGDLTPAFEELAETWSIEPNHWNREELGGRVMRRLGLGNSVRRPAVREVQKFAARRSPALIYANSVASAPIIDVLEPGAPVLTHIHELDYTLGLFAGPEQSRLFARTSRFIACSNAVRENLLAQYGLPADAVITVHESIPIEQILTMRKPEEIRQQLNIPTAGKLVLGCGTIYWIKGPDLFLQLALEVCRRRADVYFVWVGGGPKWEIARFEHDIRQAGLSESVRLTGAVENAGDYLAAADLFVLTSRQDSYPLTCLEAAALGKPIVCFANAGGAPELVEDDCGFVVPYLDVQAMTRRVISLLDSEECRVRMGAMAQRKVAERHGINQAAHRITEIIEQTISSK